MATAVRTYASIDGVWRDVSKKYVSVNGVWVPRDGGAPADPYVEDGSFSALDYLRENPTTDLNWSGWAGDGTGASPRSSAEWVSSRDALIITIENTFTADDILQMGDFATAQWPSSEDIDHPFPDPNPDLHPMIRVESRWQSTVLGGQFDLGLGEVYWSPAITADWGYWGMYTGLSVDVENPKYGPPPPGYWNMFFWTGPGQVVRAQEIEITGLRTTFLKLAT